MTDGRLVDRLLLPARSQREIKRDRGGDGFVKVTRRTYSKTFIPKIKKTLVSKEGLLLHRAVSQTSKLNRNLFSVCIMLTILSGRFEICS